MINGIGGRRMRFQLGSVPDDQTRRYACHRLIVSVHEARAIRWACHFFNFVRHFRQIEPPSRFIIRQDHSVWQLNGEN